MFYLYLYVVMLSFGELLHGQFLPLLFLLRITVVDKTTLATNEFVRISHLFLADVFYMIKQ